MSTKTSPDLLLRNTLVSCRDCRTISRLPQDLTRGMLPVVLRCPACNKEEMWEALPNLPKIAPPQREVGYFVVTGVETIDIPVEKIPEEFVEENQEHQARMSTFFGRAEQLSGMLRQMLELSSALQNDVGEFAYHLDDHFKDTLRISSIFKDCYDPGFMQEFLYNPFVAIPIPCEDKLAREYTRWLLSPKFYKTNLGIKLYGVGGFRLEMVNSYTRLFNPGTSVLWEYLGCPRTPRLEVYGRKIIGADLRYTNNDIPGIDNDVDNCPEWPSVVIEDHASARSWLAAHGVYGWQKVPMPKEDVYNVNYDMISDNPLYKTAWRRFRSASRIGIFWPRAIEARQFAFYASCLIKGVKLVIVGNPDYEVFWREVVRYGGHVQQGSYVYAANLAEIGVEVMNREATCIIVDLSSGVDKGRLEALYEYKGKLLVVGTDPIMDAEGENEYARLAYGLVADVSYEHNEDIAAEWDTRLLNPHAQVVQSFNKLRRKS